MLTRFNFTPFFLCALLLVFSGASVFFFLTGRFTLQHSPAAQAVFFLCIALEILFALGYPLLALYRIRIEYGSLIYSWLILPRTKTIPLSRIDGYYSVLVPSRQAEYITFYPVSRGRVLPAVSSFLFENSADFIAASGLTHLGRLPFTWRLYFIHILLQKKLP
jgi:hypothetical protein